MSIRPWRDIQRKKTRKIRVGNIEIGGDAPISVQSMTNTLTTDVKATIEQIKGLIQTGGKFGMTTMNQSLFDLVDKKLVTKDEALLRSTDPEDLHRQFMKWNR